MKLKIIERIATTVYIVLCIFERPAWCVHPDYAKSDGMGGYEYWYCQN